MKTVNHNAGVKDTEDRSEQTEETISTLESMMSQSLGQIEEVMGDILNESSSSLNLNEKLRRRNSLRDSERSDFSKEDLEDGNTENTMESLFSEASLNLDYMLERKDSQRSVTSEANSEYSFLSGTEEDELHAELLDAEKEESRTHNEMIMANVNRMSMDLKATRKSEVELKNKLDKLRDQLAHRRALRERISMKVVKQNVIIQPKTVEEPTVEEAVVELNATADEDETVEISTKKQSWLSSLRAKRRKVKRELPKRYAELPSANRDADGLVTKIQSRVKNKYKQKEQNRGHAELPKPNVSRSFFPRRRILFSV